MQEEVKKCCSSCHYAASKGHADCYKALLEDEPRGPGWTDVYRSVSLALQRGHEEFARDLFSDREDLARVFVMHSIWHDDATSLGVMVRLEAGMPGTKLAKLAASNRSVNCLRLVLENVVHREHWDPVDLLHAASGNRLDILEVVMEHRPHHGWCSTLPALASALGNLAFLKRIFEKRCPMWKVADDNVTVAPVIRECSLLGLGWQVQLQGWSLVVVSDLARSGPVLLYAAGRVPNLLTPRMRQMLEEVRRRAQTLAGCFWKASVLRKKPGPHARTWGPMGSVPAEVVERIATLARISIAVKELID